MNIFKQKKTKEKKKRHRGLSLTENGLHEFLK